MKSYKIYTTVAKKKPKL